MSRVRFLGVLFALPAMAMAQTPPLPAPVPLSLAASAEGKKDYALISIEELLNKDITVAATKTRVDVAQAPVSVVVITPEDIARTGATSLGQVLRTVPGLDVIEAFPGHISVSARGTSEVFVNNMLVLIDGRRLEFQVAGVPFLENAPVRLEDVKRIEVIKGPVSALYGTNALAGIISITTFSPDDVQGTLVSVTGGERDTLEATVRHAGRLGADWSYKIVGGYTYTNTWSSFDANDTRPSRAIGKGDLLGVIERRFADDARLTFEGGFTSGDLGSLSLITYQTRQFSWPHLRVAYARPDFHAQVSAIYQDSELRDFVGPLRVTDGASAVNFSVDRTFSPAASSRITVGGNVRYERSRFTVIGTPHDQLVGAAFVQDEQQIVGDKLKIYGALGVSTHPEIPTQVDGNLALVWSPATHHALRLSAGRAHRDPSFNENFFDFLRSPTFYLGPNTDLDPESLRALEFGYHGRVRFAGTSSLRFFAEGFVEEVNDLLELVTTRVPQGSIAGRPTVTVLQRFENIEDRDGKGFETGAEWSRGSFGLLGQYAYQRFTNAANDQVIRKNTPQHKFSGALRFHVGRLEVDVWGHTVSSTSTADSYVLVNPRVAYRAGGWLFSAQGYNVLDDRHIEGKNDLGVAGETLRRAVSFSISRNFAARTKP